MDQPDRELVRGRGSSQQVVVRNAKGLGERSPSMFIARRVSMLAAVSTLGCSGVPAAQSVHLEESRATCFARIMRRESDRSLSVPPRERTYWRRYDLPNDWREKRIDEVVGSVGRPLDHDGWIDEVVVDHAAGTIWALADSAGHSLVVVSLGGCALWPEPPCHDCVIVVVRLFQARQEDARRALAFAVGQHLQSTIDAATWSVVLSGPLGDVRRAERWIEAMDCAAAR